MVTLLFLTIGGLALLTGAWRLVRALRRGGPRGLASAVGALGAALIALADPVQQLTSQLYPSLGRLISNVCTLAAAYGLLLTVSELAAEAPSRARRRVRLGGWLAAELVLLGSFFATSDLPRGLGLFGGLYRTHPTLLVYVLTYTFYLAVAVTEVLRVVASTLRPSRGPLRAGLVALLLACVLGLTYLVGKLVLLGLALSRPGTAESRCYHPLDGTHCLINVTAPALSILAGVFGLLLMTAGVRLAQWWARRTLAPLHRAVVARVPAVRRDRVARRSADRLVRTVVEIRDGMLSLGIGDGSPEQVARAVWQAQPEGAKTSLPHYGSDHSQPSDLWGEVERLRPIAQAYVRLSSGDSTVQA